MWNEMYRDEHLYIVLEYKLNGKKESEFPPLIDNSLIHIKLSKETFQRAKWHGMVCMLGGIILICTAKT